MFVRVHFFARVVILLMNCLSSLAENIPYVPALLFKDLVFITQELFTSNKDNRLQTLSELIGNYIKYNPSNKPIIEKVLGVFAVIRPKEHEFLEKLEETISIKHSENTKSEYHPIPFRYQYIHPK